jgi:hypothetical protein
MAQRYSEWARQQVDRADRTLNPKARNDRLALAEYYRRLADAELVAEKRLAAIKADTANFRAHEVRHAQTVEQAAESAARPTSVARLETLRSHLARPLTSPSEP